MELQILQMIQSVNTPWLDPIMIFVSAIGNSGIFWILTALILLVFKKTRKCGVFMLITMAICFIVGNLGIKNIVARERPFTVATDIVLKIPIPSEYSFPSGHTMNGFAAATTIFLFYKKPGIFALLLASLIAFSRMYLFVHYPTDILGGIVIGAGAANLVYKLLYHKILTGRSLQLEE